MSYTVDIPRTAHKLTFHRSVFGSITGVLAVLTLSNGITVNGIALLAITLWAVTSTTWSYYNHTIVGLALAGCAAHAVLYQTLLRPAGYVLGIIAVALYWRHYR